MLGIVLVLVLVLVLEVAAPLTALPPTPVTRLSIGPCSFRAKY
ncbi:MAG: hypothetical protein ACKV19_09325 [Verrucomicrobiales bacterium]